MELSKSKALTFSCNEERRAYISEQYLKGRYQHEIAADLGVTKQAIQKILSKIRRQWVSKADKSTEQYMTEQLEKLDLLEATYWDGFTKTQTPDRPGGDPQFLLGLQKVVERRAKLLGLDAPQKIEGGFVVLTPQALSQDQWEKAVIDG